MSAGTRTRSPTCLHAAFWISLLYARPPPPASALHGHFAYRKCGTDPAPGSLGTDPRNPRCSLEAPIAVAARVQAQTERCLIKEGWLPRDFPPGGWGVLSYLPLGNWRVRAAKERRWRGEEGILGRPKGRNRWKHNQALLRGLSASRAAPGRPAPGVRGLEAGSALGGGSLPVRAAPRGAEEAPGPGREREGGGRWYPCISISPVVRSPAFKEASQLPQSPLLWKANCARCCSKTQAPVYPGPAQSITILSERGLCLAQGHVAGHPAPPRFLSIFSSSQSFIS